MAYAINDTCVVDTACLDVCPVECIAPSDGTALADAEMLFIDPKTCIDCNACAEACPVLAIRPDRDYLGEDRVWVEHNADYFTSRRL